MAGAPVLFGVPLPRGVLRSPDQVRLLAPDGREVPSQISEVSTWAPADDSIKWIWVFFFAEASDRYTLEFGDAVRRAEAPAPHVSVLNNQRPGGYLIVDTGPMKFEVRKGPGGFLSHVQIDRDRNGFGDADVVAEGAGERGSFVDLLDDEGLDPSRAVVERMVIERGSGPMHAILRVEGQYFYGRKTHPAAPFVTRIHAYAGRTALRIDHTFIYTGDPDMHTKQAGQHAHVATEAGAIITEDPNDAGWTQPRDRLAAAGVAVTLALRNPSGRTAVGDGRWWERRSSHTVEFPAGAAGPWSVLQTGPEPNRIPPFPESTPATRIDGFAAQVSSGGARLASGDRAEGWLRIASGRSEVSMALPRFLEEYPKEIRYEPDGGRLTAYFWSPSVEPMSFARWSSALDREEETISVENNARGIAKTTEVAIDFAADGGAGVATPARAFVEAPVAHVTPSWYGASGVFGRFAALSDRDPALQRSIDYKFDWMLFNQRWMPWYGMWDYGDWRLYFDGEKWTDWGNNEPAEDYICWLQFMRTGDARVYDAARANSRHSMDVDNVHWPAEPHFVGDSNVALDYWEFDRARRTGEYDGPAPSPYVGIGSRHAKQHWVKTLSAHVWVQGWLADYYLTGDHRGLDVAIETADMHLRRIWGEHGLTGRRLYLAAWNVLDVWDATKDERYEREADDLVGRMLRLQDREQGGSLSMDRYGYADVYITHALAMYLDLTGDARVRTALARHARRVRDVPALNHEFESYMSGVYALVLGWDLTGEPSLLAEARRRLEALKMDALQRPIDDTWTLGELFTALDKASHLPRSAIRNSRALPIWSATNGLRVFGWTNAYVLPFALERLEKGPGPRAQGSGGRQ